MNILASKLKVILSHDIDWPPSGPGKDHVLARKDRFDEETLKRVIIENFNPYNNIYPILDIEERFGVKSTFFFRPSYDDGTSVAAYVEEMKTLRSRGWEVGAHINDATSLTVIKYQKEQIEDVLGKSVVGCRVHYLRTVEGSFSFMKQAGFSYDSSLMGPKDSISEKNTGYTILDGLVVFPITLMDAYLFTYMKVNEERIIDVFKNAIETAKPRGYMTVIWHDNSLRMKGGRMYSKICEYLASRDDLDLIRAHDAFLAVTEKEDKR